MFIIHVQINLIYVSNEHLIKLYSVCLMYYIEDDIYR